MPTSRNGKKSENCKIITMTSVLLYNHIPANNQPTKPIDSSIVGLLHKCIADTSSFFFYSTLDRSDSVTLGKNPPQQSPSLLAPCPTSTHGCLLTNAGSERSLRTYYIQGNNSGHVGRVHWYEISSWGGLLLDWSLDKNSKIEKIQY